MSKQKKAEAEKAIAIFFKEAEKCSRQQEIATRLVRKAKNLAMHFNIKLPYEIRKKFCKKCGTFFTAKNCNTRIKYGFLVLHCLNCDNISRYKIRQD